MFLPIIDDDKSAPTQTTTNRGWGKPNQPNRDNVQGPDANKHTGWSNRDKTNTSKLMNYLV